MDGQLLASRIVRDSEDASVRQWESLGGDSLAKTSSSPLKRTSDIKKLESSSEIPEKRLVMDRSRDKKAGI